MSQTYRLPARKLVDCSSYDMVSEVGGQRVVTTIEETFQVSPNLIIFYIKGSEQAWAMHPEDQVEIVRAD